MKKVYVKPDIVFEDFSLSVSIATKCEYEVGSPDRAKCAVMGSEGIAFFTRGTGSPCEYDPADLTDLGYEADKYNGFCYHNPSEEFNLFNS